MPGSEVSQSVISTDGVADSIARGRADRGIELSTVSVVVPVYNDAPTLDPLVERLSAVLPTCALAYEIILVDDGSKDTTWEAISSLSRRRPECRGLRLMRNYGQHNALLAGIRQAKYDIIVTLDADLQNPPEEIPRLLDGFATGADVIYGTPRENAHGFARKLASRTARYVLEEAMGADGAVNVSPFHAFHTSMRDGFAHVDGPAINVDVLLGWSTTQVHRVYVRHDERTVGASAYTFGTMLRHAFNLLTGFSTQPLRMASKIGFGFTVFGALLLVYVLTHYFVVGGSVPGLAFLASVIAVFSGAQLFTLGIIGEYLARMYNRMMERPSYVVGRATPVQINTPREVSATENSHDVESEFEVTESSSKTGHPNVSLPPTAAVAAHDFAPSPIDLVESNSTLRDRMRLSGPEGRF